MGKALYRPAFFGTQFHPRGLKNGTHFVHKQDGVTGWRGRHTPIPPHSQTIFREKREKV
jgi:hypothetical protein